MRWIADIAYEDGRTATVAARRPRKDETPERVAELMLSASRRGIAFPGAIDIIVREVADEPSPARGEIVEPAPSDEIVTMKIDL